MHADIVVFSHIQELSGSLDSIEFWNGETGWPTNGGTDYEAATAGTDLAARYYSESVCGMLDWGVNVFYFEAFDEPWKVEDEGDPGPHWGYREADGRLKPGLRPVFDGPLSPPMPPSLDFTFPEAEVGASVALHGAHHVMEH